MFKGRFESSVGAILEEISISLSKKNKLFDVELAYCLRAVSTRCGRRRTETDGELSYICTLGPSN